MKFQIQLKDPDGVYDSISDAAITSVKTIAGITEDDRDVLEEEMKEKLEDQCRQWIAYGEYLTVEIDTDANTATVLRVRE